LAANAALAASARGQARDYDQQPAALNPLRIIENVPRARMPVRVPVVLIRDEVARLR
jgi:hypothetical protein